HSLIELAPPVEKAFLVAVDTGDDGGWTAEESLAELANLATTAGASVVGAEWQNRRHVDPNWYVGKGKAEELVSARSETGFDLLVTDDELSPAQQKALESLLKVKVIDRSRLILDIFALHARTHEGRLQVELAQLEYQLPRLTPSASARAEDMLFATLDPTSRQVRLGEGQTVIVTDTVGFIHKLPHQLVDAFRATLEEVNRADVLLEVVDAADPHGSEHRRTVQLVLDELGAGDKPRLAVFNKVDLVNRSARNGDTPAPVVAGTVSISARTGYGLDALRAELSALLASLWVEVDVVVPYAASELLARVRERGTVEIDYRERDVRVHGRMAPSLAGELEAIGGRWAEEIGRPNGAAAGR